MKNISLRSISNWSQGNIIILASLLLLFAIGISFLNAWFSIHAFNIGVLTFIGTTVLGFLFHFLFFRGALYFLNIEEKRWSISLLISSIVILFRVIGQFVDFFVLSDIKTGTISIVFQLFLFYISVILIKNLCDTSIQKAFYAGIFIVASIYLLGLLISGIMFSLV